MSMPELLSLLLNDDVSLAERDETLYYVLSERVAADLRRKFKPYSEKLIESPEDAIQDYFLYLRGEDSEPYRRLKSIRNATSLRVWLVTTFRNFISRKVTSENRSPKAVLGTTVPEMANDDSMRDEKMIDILSTLVAYCCQEFTPMNRFIFLRTLLTLLDKSCAVPEKKMAEAMWMTDTYYRVMHCRVWRKVREFRIILISGGRLNLTPDSQRFAADLNENFNGWYQKIMKYYETTLASLPQAESISGVRVSRSDGLLHDHETVPYGRNLTAIRTLWSAVDSYFTRATRVKYEN